MRNDRLTRRRFLRTGGLMAALAAFAGSALSKPRVTLAQRDPQLEPGFPVQTRLSGGAYHPIIYSAVGDLDGDPALEIVTSALAGGPLHA